MRNNSGVFMKKAFTLIELSVVILIIGILATIIMVSLSASMAKSRDSQRKSDLTQIAAALENYRADNKVYPNDAGTLSFVSAYSGITVTPTFSTYMPTIPKDPKDPASQYEYKSDGDQFKLVATAPETLANLTVSDDAKDLANEFFDPSVVSGSPGCGSPVRCFRRFQISSSQTALAW